MKKFIAGLKLAGLIVIEVLAIAYPVAALTFWLCYLGDIWWGQHLMEAEYEDRPLSKLTKDMLDLLGIRRSKII